MSGGRCKLLVRHHDGTAVDHLPSAPSISLVGRGKGSEPLPLAIMAGKEEKGNERS
jgi:hypothetical protein